MGYLSVADFKLRTIMPAGDVDVLEASAPGFLQLMLDETSEEIDAKLRKRYGNLPFNTPYPKTILRWLVKIVTLYAYEKRGYDATSDRSREVIEGTAAEAVKQVDEAANSEIGLYDLPIYGGGTSGSAINAGGPLGYTEQSPFGWTTLQARDGKTEDFNR